MSADAASAADEGAVAVEAPPAVEVEAAVEGPLDTARSSVAEGQLFSRPKAGGVHAGHRYNPGLDGIRAISVIAILLYHGGVTFLPGGFLGVDIFFVLSGYLITSLLLLEHDRTQTLHLKNFWIRRARRLLPALVLMVAGVLVLFPMLDVEWPQSTRGDALAVLFYVSNWWFVLRGESYAQAFEDPSPFQHTWSLAIEEQWYLLLPLALLVLFRSPGGRRVLGWLLAIAALASAGLMAALQSTSDGSRAYYGTDTRLQGLLVGAAFACFAVSPMGRKLLDNAVVAVLGWIGLAGLLVAFVLAAQADPRMYQGGFLLLSVASVLVVASVVGTSKLSPNVLLSWQPLVVVGVLSYGIYLWHWPVYLVLSPERTGIDGVPLLIVRIAFTALVSIASFVIVERPLRIGAPPNSLASPQVAGPIAAAALVAALVGVAVPGVAGIKEESADSVDSLAAVAADRTQGGTGANKILLVGDSNALSLFAAVRDDPGPDVNLSIATRFGCGVVPYTASVEGKPLSPEQPLCTDWAAVREMEIEAAAPSVGVLFAGSWEQYDRWIGGRTVPYTSDAWLEATTADYVQVLREILKYAPRAVVVLNHCHQVPDTGLPAATMFAAGRYPPVLNDAKRVAATNEAAKKAAATLGNKVAVIDPNPFLCKSGYTSELNGVTLRTDGLHLTTAGGKLVWGWLRPQLTATR
ncbi:acyltransferase family protein [Cryptosporangium aurantiacum]|uniref:acyltransferase family protein n=1 Tax=Cryptosporangium aurantiacum TaxID=134849 RepID=UPI000932234C|nr:acyltransferase family protein [Cryptosporangium aurantiacum]